MEGLLPPLMVAGTPSSPWLQPELRSVEPSMITQLPLADSEAPGTGLPPTLAETMTLATGASATFTVLLPCTRLTDCELVVKLVAATAIV